MKKLWRRDLFPAEQKVNYKQLNDRWDTLENKFVDNTIPIFKQVMDKLLVDLEVMLDSKDYNSLKDIRIGYRDKMVNVIKQILFEAFKTGKGSVHEELNINNAVDIGAKERGLLIAKAEALVTYIYDKVRSNMNFLVLKGIRENLSTNQILQSVQDFR